MSANLRIAITVPSERFDVELAWETDEPALGLFGPSGAGKTTVLEALAGLRRGVRGRIELGGRTWLDSERGLRLPPQARGVSYVPQDLLLFPHLDVLGNLRFGERRAARSPKRLTAERVLEVLELTALAHRRVPALSGGERQRVALGRALCAGPDLLLLDEPLASLDLELRRRILPYLLRVREEFAIPTLHVSHDPAETALLANEITVLEAGKVVDRGNPGRVFGGHALRSGHGADAVVNVLRGIVGELAESAATVHIAPDLRIVIADDGTLTSATHVAVELRASEILIARGPAAALSAQNILAATVDQVHLPAADDRAAAAVVSCRVGSGSHQLAAIVTRRAVGELDLVPGCEVKLIFKAQACRVLAGY